MPLSSLPILLLDAAWLVVSVVLLLVGTLRSAVHEGTPVTFARLLRAPAAPCAPIGLVLGSLCALWTVATLLGPAIAARILA